MAAARKPSEPRRSRKRPPATTPEAREKQLIALAVDRAEQQILDGTVSAQVLTHYLKLATAREALERKKLERENELLSARVEQLGSFKQVEELYSNALNAMREYSGHQVADDDYED